MRRGRQRERQRHECCRQHAPDDARAPGSQNKRQGAATERLVTRLIVDVLHDLAHQMNPRREDPGHDARAGVPHRDRAVLERQAGHERHRDVAEQATGLEHG